MTHEHQALESLQQQILLEMQQNYQAQLDAAQTAAATGTGPQPWDKDWPFDSFDTAEHFASINAGPVLLSRMLQMADWALASPQGRKALISDGRPNSPHQDTLDTIRLFRSAVGDSLREWATEHPMAFSRHICDFNLFEHLTTCREFCPDWFTTGELIEMADWALASSTAQQAQLDWTGAELEARRIVEVIQAFGEALGIRRRRLLLEQATTSLNYSAEILANLEKRLEF